MFPHTFFVTFWWHLYKTLTSFSEMTRAEVVDFMIAVFHLTTYRTCLVTCWKILGKKNYVNFAEAHYDVVCNPPSGSLARIHNLNVVIPVPADALAPNGDRPSAGTVLTMKLGIFHSILIEVSVIHDDVIKWKHFPRNWSFVRGIHRSPVNSPHKGQWRGDLMFSLICVWINGWVNNREAGD